MKRILADRSENKESGKKYKKFKISLSSGKVLCSRKEKKFLPGIQDEKNLV
jgi:hypothetical protein